MADLTPLLHSSLLQISCDRRANNPSSYGRTYSTYICSSSPLQALRVHVRSTRDGVTVSQASIVDVKAGFSRHTYIHTGARARAGHDRVACWFVRGKQVVQTGRSDKTASIVDFCVFFSLYTMLKGERLSYIVDSINTVSPG